MASDDVMMRVASITPNTMSTDCARRRGMLRSAMRRRMRLTPAKRRRPSRMRPTAPAIQPAMVMGGTPKKLVMARELLLTSPLAGEVGGRRPPGGDDLYGTIRGD